MINLINNRYSKYAPILVSLSIAINGIVTIIATAIPVINRIFSVDIDSHLTSDLYNIGMEFNVGIGIAMPIILGYLMILIAKGIFQRKRAYWRLAVIFITLSMLGDYIQDKHFSYDITFSLHAVEIILLLIFKKQFNETTNRKFTFQQFIISLTFFLAIAYSVLGVYGLKDEFEGIDNFTDAIYFTLVTFSTVGYGDIHPLTNSAKIFTVSVMVIGIGVFASVVTLLAGSIINKITDKFKFDRGASLMNNHLIICGYTEITKCLIKDYFDSQVNDLVIIEKNYQQRFINMDEEQKKHFIDAESHDYDALKKSNITKAKAVFILNEKDSDNILTLLAIKEVLKGTDKTPRISIKLDKDESINIANNLGVDQIVSPTKKIAELLIES
jgi:voltage-gated potassium channel